MDNSLLHRINGAGPLNAEILVLSDCASKEEIQTKKPYSSGANRELVRYIRGAGLDDGAIRFEYLMENTTPTGHFSSVGEQDFYLWVNDTLSRLRRLTNLKVIVTVGPYATKAILGSRFRGISDDHCYVYPPVAGVNYWVIPCLSPTFILRGNQEKGFWLKVAFNKAKAITDCPPVNKSLDLIIQPSWDQMKAFMAEPNPTLVSVDIETTRTMDINSIALSYDGWRAIAIPFKMFDKAYWTANQLEVIHNWLKSLLLNPEIGKLYQNFIFDTMVLWKYGFSNRGEIHDTMTRGHLLSPELGKSLADLGRLHLMRPSWKGWDNFDKIKDWTGFWRYNALDAAYTYQIYDAQTPMLKEVGVYDFYDKHLVPLSRLVFDVCTRGWSVDVDGLHAVKADVEGLVQGLKGKMREIAEPLGIAKFNPNSPKQLKELFKALKFKVPTKDFKETTNEEALVKMQLKYNHEIFGYIMEHRKEAKFLSTYLNMGLDEDKRLRFTYVIPGTVTSRFSSKETPWGTGTNSQNIHPRFKKFVRADQGKLLIQTDLDRADAQVVAWLSQEETMLELLRTGADLHVYTANMVFGEDITTLPAEEYEKKRKIGKAANHALNYGMQAQTFRNRLLKSTGLVITLAEAQNVINKYFEAYPKLLDWQEEIRTTVTREKKLLTPHGRVRFFLGWVNDKMFREAYAYIPPTTVSDSINITAVALQELIQKNYVNMQILGQCHDSLLLQVAERHLDIGIDLLDNAMKSSVFYIHGKACVIPHGVEVGSTWGDLVKYDRRKQ